MNTLDECTTLWGKLEQVYTQKCHQNVNEPQATEYRTHAYNTELWVRSSYTHAAYRLVQCARCKDRWKHSSCVIWHMLAPITVARRDQPSDFNTGNVSPACSYTVPLSCCPSICVAVVRVFYPCLSHFELVYDGRVHKIRAGSDLRHDIRHTYIYVQKIYSKLVYVGLAQARPSNKD